MNGTIWGIVGNRGGGKSRFAAKTIYEHLRRGAYVWTNMEMNAERIAERLASEGLRFDPTRLNLMEGDAVNWHTRIARGTASEPVLVVLDEAHFKYAAREFHKTPKEDLAMMTLARKLDIHLVLISQRILKMDKQIRDDFDVIWTCKNLRQWKIAGTIPCPVPVNIRIMQDTWMGSLETRAREFVFGEEWVNEIYNSDALLGHMAEQLGSLPVLEAKALDRIQKPDTGSALDWAAALSSLCACFFVF